MTAFVDFLCYVETDNVSFFVKKIAVVKQRVSFMGQQMAKDSEI